MYRPIKELPKRILYLFAIGSPLRVVVSHIYFTIRDYLSRKLSRYGRGQIEKREEFRQSLRSLTLDNDWFTHNVPTWLRAIDSARLRERESISCLEVGSWQGLSAFFTLSELPNASILCVDTWEGADEHKAGDFASAETLSRVEAAFDENLSAFQGRVRKLKMTSLEYYARSLEKEEFDLIYIDGSHHSDDVVVDAIKSFEKLKVGGLLIFDDYFWTYYENPIDNPAAAVNLLLRLKKGRFDIVCFDYQIVIRKTANSAR